MSEPRAPKGNATSKARRRVQKDTLAVEHKASQKSDQINGFVDLIRKPETAFMLRSGFNQLTTDLALFAAILGDPRLNAAVEALIDLDLATGDPWKAIAAKLGDPSNTAIAEARLACAQEFHNAGMSKREAAERAAAMFGGGAFDGLVQTLRTQITAPVVGAKICTDKRLEFQQARQKMLETIGGGRAEPVLVKPKIAFTNTSRKR